MRVDVKKFLFVGISEERARFFEQAQATGFIHFVENRTKTKDLSPGMQTLLASIKILKGLSPLTQEELDDHQADSTAQQIVGIKQKWEYLAEERRIIKLEIARVEIFGDFSLEEVAAIERDTGRQVKFYCAKHGHRKKEELPPEGFLFVGNEHGLDYYIAIEKAGTSHSKFIEMHIKQPIGQLRQRLEEIEMNLHQIDLQLKPYAKYNAFLHHALIQKMNNYNLYSAKEDVSWELDRTLFSVEGWVPVNKIDELQLVAESLNVHMEQIAANPEEVPPTCLENEGMSRLGEDLVNIYDTPSHADKDPSLWVLLFFALFFAFIVGDGGYGLIFLCAALFIRYKYSLSRMGKRFINITMILSFAIIAWGILTTSFFGINFGIDSPLRKISLIQWMAEKKAAYSIEQHDQDWHAWVEKFPQLESITDPYEFLKSGQVESKGKISYEILEKYSDNILFELALFIGVVHIILSLLRYSGRNWPSFGWVLFLIGAYFYLPGFLDATSMIHFVFGIDKTYAAESGLYLIGAGIVIATLLAVFKHKWLGLFEPTNVLQLFADAMSYLRLYALGLSGAMLTATFLELASSVNIVIGIFILICGHLINMVLSIMGGTIHGLRLNFLEWYHYSFEGNGKPFKPLQKLTID